MTRHSYTSREDLADARGIARVMRHFHLQVPNGIHWTRDGFTLDLVAFCNSAEKMANEIEWLREQLALAEAGAKRETASTDACHGSIEVRIPLSGKTIPAVQQLAHALRRYAAHAYLPTEEDHS